MKNIFILGLCFVGSLFLWISTPVYADAITSSKEGDKPRHESLPEKEETAILPEDVPPMHERNIHFSPGEGGPQRQLIEFGYPDDSYNLSDREEAVFLPVKRIKTVGGTLATYGEDHPAKILWLDGDKWIALSAIRFEAVYPEKDGLPSIIVAHMEMADSSVSSYISEFGEYHVIDMAGTLPRVTQEHLPLSSIEISKVDADTYSFSGGHRTPDDVAGEKETAVYHYNRITGKITRIE